jgi:epoxyqueuosine reductase
LETAILHDHSRKIRAIAESLGFAACGISPANRLEQDEARLHNWLLNGYHGEMDYMARNFDKRTDPCILLPGAKSVISVLMNYYPEESLSEGNHYKIARYAYGKDYHLVIREKLNLMISRIKQFACDFQARAFTDSAPVLEKAWAARSGLGWIGKNTCLIHPKLGSYVFLGEIITDLVLAYDDRRINDLCGGCNRCIESCPTGAILAPRLLAARKCISYLTIEYRGDLPPEEKDHFKGWIFGCDICQEVCPWNRKATPARESAFIPSPGLKAMDKEKWEDLTEEQFNDLFRESAINRTKFSGLKRNITFLKKSDQ